MRILRVHSGYIGPYSKGSDNRSSIVADLPVAADVPVAVDVPVANCCVRFVI
jgi:hypothetical protein